MTRIANLKKFFNNHEKQIEKVYKEQKLLTLKIDRDIASFMGAPHPEQIGIIRGLLDSYKWVQEKKSNEKEISEVEAQLIGEVPIEIVSNQIMG